MRAVRRPRVQKAIEREYGRPLREVVEHLLYDRRLTQDQVARRLGVSQPSISAWLAGWEEVDNAQPQPEAAAV